jgi:hypothetical protein
MENLEAVHNDRFVHTHGERQIVRGIFEKGVAPHVNFMEVDVREKLRQAKRLPVRNEVDLVTASRQSNTELSGDRA